MSNQLILLQLDLSEGSQEKGIPTGSEHSLEPHQTDGDTTEEIVVLLKCLKGER